MELTPEERRKIYEEEKARLEGITIELTPEQARKIYLHEKVRRERIKQLESRSSHDSGGGFSLGWALLVVVIVLAVLFSTGILKIDREFDSNAAAAHAEETAQTQNVTMEDYSGLIPLQPLNGE
jgi:hypothetical protein